MFYHLGNKYLRSKEVNSKLELYFEMVEVHKNLDEQKK